MRTEEDKIFKILKENFLKDENFETNINRTILVNLTQDVADIVKKIIERQYRNYREVEIEPEDIVKKICKRN